MREFFDVVHHAVQLPLSVDLGFAAQRKPIQSLVAAQIAEHGFHRREAARDHRFAGVGVDFDFHLVRLAGRAAFTLKEGDLARFLFRPVYVNIRCVARMVGNLVVLR